MGEVCCTQRHLKGPNDSIARRSAAFPHLGASDSCIPGFGDFLLCDAEYTEEDNKNCATGARRVVVAAADQLSVYSLKSGGLAGIDKKYDHKFNPNETLTAIRFYAFGSSFIVGALSVSRVQLSARDNFDVDVIPEPLTDPKALLTFGRRVVLRRWSLNGHFTQAGRDLVGPTATVTCIAASRTWLFAGDVVGSVFIWDKTYDCAEVGSFQCHTGGVASLDVDEDYLFSCGSSDGTFAVWARNSCLTLMHRVNMMEGIPARVCDDKLRFGCGEMLRYDGDGSTPLFNALEESQGQRSDQVVVRMQNLSVIQRTGMGWPVNRNQNRFSNALGLVFIACEDTHRDGCIVAYNFTHSKVVRASWAHMGSMTSLAFGPCDNGPLFSGGMDATIKVWDVATLQCVKEIDAHGSYAVQAVVAEKRRGIISLGANGVLKVWNLVP